MRCDDLKTSQNFSVKTCATQEDITLLGKSHEAAFNNQSEITGRVCSASKYLGQMLTQQPALRCKACQSQSWELLLLLLLHGLHKHDLNLNLLLVCLKSNLDVTAVHQMLPAKRVSAETAWTGPGMHESVENMCDKAHFEKLQAHISYNTTHRCTPAESRSYSLKMGRSKRWHRRLNRLKRAKILKRVCHFSEAVRIRCASSEDKQSVGLKKV